MTTAIVIGGNFAGFTAALELKRKLGKDAEVLVIDKSPVFLFIPSLIWVPFRRREIKDISVPKADIFKKKGVDFLHAEALSVDPVTQTVVTTKGSYSYDQLVIATGPKVNYDIAPGIKEHAYYIGPPQGAMDIRNNPGPIVIGATQFAGCMGAGYEFLFNMDKWLRENGIRKKVDLYWVTPETYLGHFGIDGMWGGKQMLTGFMKMYNIHYRTESSVAEVTANEVILGSGERIASSFTMFMPPFIGVDMIRNSPLLQASANGFLPVDDTYRHPVYPNIWAAGLTVDVKPPFTPGKVPFTIPKTGYPSDETGKIVANNIVRVLKGNTKLVHKSWGKIPGLCIMDAGKKEVIIISDHLFKPRKFAIMIPNIFYDFTKVALEKYFLWKTKKGYSQLP